MSANDEAQHLLERMMPRHYEIQEAEMLREFLNPEPPTIGESVVIIRGGRYKLIDIWDVPEVRLTVELGGRQ